MGAGLHRLPGRVEREITRAHTCSPVQPCLWVVRGKVCPETGAAWAWKPGWQGRGRQLTEVWVSRPGFGGDHGRSGVSAGAAAGRRGRFRGLVAKAGGYKSLCIGGALERHLRHRPFTLECGRLFLPGAGG